MSSSRLRLLEAENEALKRKQRVLLRERNESLRLVKHLASFILPPPPQPNSFDQDHQEPTQYDPYSNLASLGSSRRSSFFSSRRSSTTSPAKPVGTSPPPTEAPSKAASLSSSSSSSLSSSTAVRENFRNLPPKVPQASKNKLGAAEQAELSFASSTLSPFAAPWSPPLSPAAAPFVPLNLAGDGEKGRETRLDSLGSLDTGFVAGKGGEEPDDDDDGVLPVVDFLMSEFDGFMRWLRRGVAGKRKEKLKQFIAQATSKAKRAGRESIVVQKKDIFLQLPEMEPIKLDEFDAAPERDGPSPLRERTFSSVSSRPGDYLLLEQTQHTPAEEEEEGGGGGG
eukprot:CAMPEP_0175159410 /NCGR_PEP_ID=MMETSP0087-20121206/23397_1 /TAXON_ID=136419 /ORGANISM="Unknown Unknown, Strain D1" /LENGTH=338 /DNA_ID=CAMNT_0016447437 /DNA_START=8 /DNA_END=1021 /DNA_ORIENTATION=-